MHRPRNALTFPTGLCGETRMFEFQWPGTHFQIRENAARSVAGMKAWDGCPSEHVPLPEGILNWDMG